MKSAGSCSSNLSFSSYLTILTARVSVKRFSASIACCAEKGCQWSYQVQTSPPKKVTGTHGKLHQRQVFLALHGRGVNARSCVDLGLPSPPEGDLVPRQAEEELHAVEQGLLQSEASQDAANEPIRFGLRAGAKPPSVIPFSRARKFKSARVHTFFWD